MVRLLAALTMTALALGAEARVGETSAECEERYGKGQLVELKLGQGLAEKRKDAAHPWQAMFYSARGLTIQVVFENDKAVFVRYSNQPVMKLAEDSPPSLQLTGPEIEFLRNANGKGWKTHKDALITKIAPTLTVWTSADSGLYAGYERERKALFVCNEEFWKVVIGEIESRYEGGAPGAAGTRLKGL